MTDAYAEARAQLRRQVFRDFSEGDIAEDVLFWTTAGPIADAMVRQAKRLGITPREIQAINDVAALDAFRDLISLVDDEELDALRERLDVRPAAGL